MSSCKITIKANTDELDKLFKSIEGYPRPLHLSPSFRDLFSKFT
jgi:hypothetical protein